MSYEQVSIHTHDGDCPAYVFRPPGDTSHPAVIFYMDGLGIRPTIFQMGQRLAEYGYVVLVPDLYYRAGRYEALEPKTVFASGDVRGAIGHLLASTDNRRAGEDTGAFLTCLDSREDVAGTKVGTTGYCMGGAMSLTAAGTYPDRIAAAASSHGGNLPPTPISAHTISHPRWLLGSMWPELTTTTPTRSRWRRGSSRRSATLAWIIVAKSIPRRCTAGR
jgi:carboxymethylenebutenolidase